MRFLLTSWFLALCLLANFNVKSQDTTHLHLLDFWVGQWKVSWKDSQGNSFYGSNKVEKQLNGKVIAEHFTILTGLNKGFEGKSFSVYDVNNKIWKQTRVDNSGGYLDFVGDFKDDKTIFHRSFVNKNGDTVYQRMVFYDFTETGFTWDWESSLDNETFKLLWRINYQKE